MMPQRISFMTEISAATAQADGVVPVRDAVNGHDRVAPFFGRPREETAYEGAVGVVDPLVLVAHHIVDGVFAPAAHALFRGAGRSQERPVLPLHQTEAGIGVSRGGV